MNSASAFSLIECITYGGLLLMIFGLAFAAYFRCMDQSKLLRRNADDIVRAMRVGERWREDVRAATNVVLSRGILHVQQKQGDVSWFFEENTVWRKGSDERAPIRVLQDVTVSYMESDQRNAVTAWRWELELNRRNPKARMRPLFTFEAVPIGGAP